MISIVQEFSEETKEKVKKWGKRLGKAAAVAGAVGTGVWAARNPEDVGDKLRGAGKMAKKWAGKVGEGMQDQSLGAKIGRAAKKIGIGSDEPSESIAAKAARKSGELAGTAAKAFRKTAEKKAEG